MRSLQKTATPEYEFPRKSLRTSMRRSEISPDAKTEKGILRVLRHAPTVRIHSRRTSAHGRRARRTRSLSHRRLPRRQFKLSGGRIMKRDLTKDQFEYQARKLGFSPQGFMGYWMHDTYKTAVSVFNAGRRRRDWISYLRKNAKQFAERAALKP